MFVRSIIARLIATLAVIGLLAGASVVPATARAVADAVVSLDAPAHTHPSASGQAAATHDDMPCCDPDASDADCGTGKVCPFAALCAAKLAAGLIVPGYVSPVAGLPVPMPLRQDRIRPGLETAPQGPPPRSRS